MSKCSKIRVLLCPDIFHVNTKMGLLLHGVPVANNKAANKYAAKFFEPVNPSSS